MFSFHHWFLLLFFQVFSFNQLSLPWLFFARYLVSVLLYRECYGFESAFFTLRRFLPNTTSLHLAQPAFIKTSLGAGSSSLKGLPLRFKRQTRPICLFESHSVQQKVLVGRFYLFFKALRNTISTCSRFWTHYLVAIRHIHYVTVVLDDCWFISVFSCCLLIHRLESNHLIQNLL